MTQTAEQYGKVLYELCVPAGDINRMESAFARIPELTKLLDNPVLAKAKKHAVIERIFPEKLHNFLKTVSDHRRTSVIFDIVESWKNCAREAAGIMSAKLYCVHDPDKSQLSQMEKFIRDTYGAKGVDLTVEHRPELIGGFILQIKDQEYDWSLRGRLRQLKQRLSV
jgi:F-type H+-transporting ATPase subunit delta